MTHTLRAFSAFVRVGATMAIAYRTEAIVWLLSTTMPLVMMAFFGAVAREGSLGHYDERGIVAYFLATFIVRSLTASWISWQINLEIRDGTLATRLLLPVHPMVGYAAEALGAMPIRVFFSVSVAVVMLVVLGAGVLTHDPLQWALFGASVAGGWLISTFVSFTIGALAFFVESSAKLMDAWLAALFVFSGYLVPVDLFPPRLAVLLDLLPFRYQIGLPVELLVGMHDRATALSLVSRQWAFVAIFAVVMSITWRRGLSRFASHGG